MSDNLLNEKIESLEKEVALLKTEKWKLIVLAARIDKADNDIQRLNTEVIGKIKEIEDNLPSKIVKYFYKTNKQKLYTNRRKQIQKNKSSKKLSSMMKIIITIVGIVLCITLFVLSVYLSLKYAFNIDLFDFLKNKWK